MDNIIKKLKNNDLIRLAGACARKEPDPDCIDFVTVLPFKKINNELIDDFKKVQLLHNDKKFTKYSINNIEVNFWKVTRIRFNYSTIYRTLPKPYLKHISILANGQRYKITKKGMINLKTNGVILDWNKIMRILWITSKNIISICNQN